MSEDFHYRKQAKESLPRGFYVLTDAVDLLPSDIVWSFSTQEFLRADSPDWLFSPLVHTEDIICAAREIGMSDFAQSVPTKRSYSIRK